MVKHDFSSFDVLGRWGFSMGADLTTGGWHFADRTKTTAEIVLGLYRTIRDAAGDALLIGCNTFSHLSAGLFELNRIGDDTSGRNWDRTRRMGVNTLAFRSCQNGTFYAADPDIAAITPDVPWPLLEKWLSLVSRSGMPLFISPDERAVGPAQRAALREALAIAANAQSPAEPLDWLDTNCPRKWNLNGKKTEFEWVASEGGWPWPNAG
jgi:alpha-galactosidase